MNSQNYPADLARITDRALMARIQVETVTGAHWYLVEIEDVSEIAGRKQAFVRAAVVSGNGRVGPHRPEIFSWQTYNGEWGCGDWARVNPTELHDVAVIENGKVVEYLGRPFSAVRPLITVGMKQHMAELIMELE